MFKYVREFGNRGLLEDMTTRHFRAFFTVFTILLGISGAFYIVYTHIHSYTKNDNS